MRGLSSLMFAIAFPALHSKVKTSEALGGRAILTGGEATVFGAIYQDATWGSFASPFQK